MILSTGLVSWRALPPGLALLADLTGLGCSVWATYSCSEQESCWSRPALGLAPKRISSILNTVSHLTEPFTKVGYRSAPCVPSGTHEVALQGPLGCLIHYLRCAGQYLRKKSPWDPVAPSLLPSQPDGPTPPHLCLVDREGGNKAGAVTSRMARCDIRGVWNLSGSLVPHL